MRKIIHVDMDCFYAAVETKFRPELKGKAMAVGGPPDSRSVLLTANYEARKFKVRSAMSSAQAIRLCPHLIFVRPNFERYKKESQAVREIFYRFTPLVEPLSLDEAYLDVTECPHFGGSATLIAQEIRYLIEKETGLTASAGIAPNKFLAKIASDWNKPNGQFVIRPADVAKFMLSLEVVKIHGVGKVTARKMHEHGIRTCGDLQKQSVPQLAQWFGSWAESLARMARGEDNRPVSPNSLRKSLTVEETFNQDLTTLKECVNELPALYEDWEKRMLRGDYRDRIRGLVCKLKFTDFKSTTHETSFRGWPTVGDFEKLLSAAWERKDQPVRLIGIGARLQGEAKKSTSQLSFALEE